MTAAEFRERARVLLARGETRFDAGPQLSLLAGAPASPAPGARVPREFARLIDEVSCHRDPSRFELLYRALFRLTHGEPDLLAQPLDADVREMRRMAQAVSHDVHHVHAFVRFRLVEGVYVAWHRPEHRVLRLAAPFFARRFPGMRWSIVTPDESAHFDGKELRFSGGAPQFAGEDALEELWLTYYAAIFNPARVNLPLLAQKLPHHHRGTLPEARLLPALTRDAGARVARMIAPDPGAAAAFLPEDRTLASLRAAARGCTACALCERATQTVFGEGPETARLVLIGEQPGDQEDLGGRPFVGPAGSVLDDALDEAGIIRDNLYVTNAVKHFKFEPRGKIRLHQRPSARDVAACRPWVEAELQAVKPETIVCLGATAGQALFGSGFRLGPLRGKLQSLPRWPRVLATWHPSAILRAGSHEQAEQMRRELVEDLRSAAKAA